MAILTIGLDNVNLDDTSYNENDPETIIHVILLAWHVKVKKRKELRKELNKELMSIAWYPKRWWSFCMSEDEEKQVDPILTE